jgi:soluble lytic murein transglycosylase-like protein
MQVMPDTALRYGVSDPGRTPEANLRAGTRYLKDLMRQFGNRLDLVLAAYNAGEKAVLRYGQRIPPYSETRHYVPAVLAKYQEWQEPSPSKPTYIEYLPGTRLDPKEIKIVR